MKAFLVSNVVMDPLKGFMRELELSIGAFNSFPEALMDHNSPAFSDDVSVLIIHLDGDEITRTGDPELLQRHAKLIEQFVRTRPSLSVIVSTLSCSRDTPLTYAEPLASTGRVATANSFNAALLTLSAQHPSLAVLDLEALYHRWGRQELESKSVWYAGRIKYSNKMFRELGRSYQELLHALHHRSKKVLVVDLDNTLWGGVIGEDGISGVALSEDGKGRCFRDFQRAIRSLAQQGVILAINSKNNRADAEEMFTRHPLMVLKLDDFSEIAINWHPKVDNLRSIAHSLNLGLDSLVFVDDSPQERESVRTALPEVAVPDMPSHPEELEEWFIHEVARRYFPRFRISAEDRSKKQQYRSNTARQELAASLDRDSFLSMLEIKTTCYIDDPRFIDRASQMTQKTNQFNMTTRRYSPGEIEQFVRSPHHAVVTIDYEDRFGQEGIVGLAIVNLRSSEVDTFLLSCRVIGRGIEERLLAEIERLVASHGRTQLKAEFIPTKKNAPAEGFFERQGFVLSGGDPGTRREYSKELI